MATSASRPAIGLEDMDIPSGQERRIKVDSGDAQEGHDKLREAQALYEKYVELAAVGERAVLDRLASATAERRRVEYTTHHSSASTLRSTS